MYPPRGRERSRPAVVDDHMQKILITLGLVLFAIGLLWPWIQKLGLGRLPGDIAVEREGFNFYFPLTTSILVSIVLSLLFWFFMRK